MTQWVLYESDEKSDEKKDSEDDADVKDKDTEKVTDDDSDEDDDEPYVDSDVERERNWKSVRVKNARAPHPLTVTHVNQTMDLQRIECQPVVNADKQNSDEWLQCHSVEFLKLTLQDLIDKGQIGKLSPDKHRGQANYQIQFEAYDVNEFEYKLNVAIEMYTKRIKYLLQGSKRIFGHLNSDRVAVCIDISDANMGFGRQTAFQESLLSCGVDSRCTNTQLFQALGMQVTTLVILRLVPRQRFFNATTIIKSGWIQNNRHLINCFELVEEVLLCHRFYTKTHSSTKLKTFNTAILKELRLLKTSLPPGILVKSFADRLDLFSIMIIGPKKTPYEDGLFFFDVQLPADYPSSPPLFHYYSFCVDRLNPNLYDDGKVCVSLLGTWAGKGNEVWTAKSNLLQVLISIQGLILVSEPYYNEAGYEKQCGSTQAGENSRMYNEMAILKLIQSLTNMAKKPPKIFEEECKKHLQKFGPRIIHQLDTWMKLCDLKTSGETSSVSKPSADACHSGIHEPEHAHQNHVQDSTCERKQLSDDTNAIHDSQLAGEEAIAEPDFPLLPVSKGFRLTLKHHLTQFRKTLEEIRPGCL